MSILLLILFVAMPIIEIALLIKLGGWLGFWPTLALVIGTAVVGTYVLRAQGIATVHRLAESIGSGEPPIAPVLDGFFLAISGAFLLTPGVVTDAMGLLLLVPPVRHAIARWGFGQVMKRANVTVHTYTTQQSGSGEWQAPPDQDKRFGEGAKRPGDGPVIDGDYEEVKKD